MYQNVADLQADPQFLQRLGAALTTESLGRVDDPLADACLRNPAVGATMFVPLVAAAPTFGEQYGTGGQEAIDDSELLSAVQASWTRVADLYPPEP
jgi:hypothetical protein